MAEKEANDVLGIKGFKDSKHYEQARPEYPREAVELLMRKIGLLDDSRDKSKQLTVLELGAGTGKFTRVMADVLKGENVRIIASDPVKEMCDQFREVLPEIEMHQFGAENIGLPDQVADAVVCSNCFHWFAYNTNTMPEIHRILKATGMLGITTHIPNEKSQSFVQKIHQYLAPHYGPVMYSITYEDAIFDLFPSSKFSELKSEVLITHENFHLEKYHQFVLTYSVVKTMTEQQRCNLLEFLNKVIEEHISTTGREIEQLEYEARVLWSKKIQH